MGKIRRIGFLKIVFDCEHDASGPMETEAAVYVFLRACVSEGGVAG